MNKFNLTVDADSLATQIAELINLGGQIWYHLTRQSILGGDVKYIIEMDKEKVIGVIGLEQKSNKVTEMKFLCVHPDYKRRGLGKKLLEVGIRNTSTDYLYGAVRSDNAVNVRNNFRIGMKAIGKYPGRGCDIIIFARRRSDVGHSIHRRRA